MSAADAGQPRSRMTILTWAALAMLVLGTLVVIGSLYEYHAAGLSPLDRWDVCKPGDDQSVVDCVDPADVPALSPDAVSTAAIAVALGGVALTLGVAAHKLRSHAAELSHVPRT